MVQTPTSAKSDVITSEQAEVHQHSPAFDGFASGLATGIVATVIVETGKSTVSLLAKNPLVMFGAGVVTGYFAHKYRKEIIVSSKKITEQSKDFVARKKQKFVEIVSESEKE